MAGTIEFSLAQGQSQVNIPGEQCPRSCSSVLLWAINYMVSPKLRDPDSVPERRFQLPHVHLCQTLERGETTVKHGSCCSSGWGSQHLTHLPLTMTDTPVLKGDGQHSWPMSPSHRSHDLVLLNCQIFSTTALNPVCCLEGSWPSVFFCLSL